MGGIMPFSRNQNMYSIERYDFERVQLIEMLHSFCFSGNWPMPRQIYAHFSVLTFSDAVWNCQTPVSSCLKAGWRP